MAVMTLAKLILPRPKRFCKSNHFACKNRHAIAPPVGVDDIASNVGVISFVGKVITYVSNRF